MTKNPSDITCAEHTFPRFCIVDVLHSILQNYCCSSMISDDSFRFTGRSACVKIVKMMVRINYNRADAFSSFFDFFKIKLIDSESMFGQQISLENYLFYVFSFTVFDSLIDDFQVINSFVRLSTSIGAYQKIGFTVNNSVSKLVSRKSSKYNNMRCSDSGTSQNGD